MANTSTRQPTHEDHREKTPSGANKPPRAYPAPRPLATPTDLKSSDVQAVVEAINPLIADAFALFTKTKNYHWHLSGPHFRDYHLLLDEQAEQIFGAIDILAERVRRIGGTTIRSISHIAQLQTIQDDNSEFVSAGDMMRRLLDD
ncbi:MAG TPA: DNA starvation/stationary phase protection protein, partial [Ktedonobacterales bacterium]|nr:DNA starvation/stationary phase protection protein [Ktedonobacterales bacterium]